MNIRTLALIVVGLPLAACGGSDQPAPRDGAGKTTEPGIEASEGTDRDRSATRKPRGGSDDASADNPGDGAQERLTPRERRVERDRIHALVRELVGSMNARDESVCTRLFTQGLIEPEKRADAVVACERGVAEQPGRLRLVEIEIVRIRETERGREAGVQFLLSAPERRTTRYAYHLVHEDGEYVIDRGIPVEQPSR